MKASSIFAVLLMALGANAHFELTRPAPRGVSQALQRNGPCGGFNAVQTSRVAISSLGGSIDVQLYWDGAIEVFLGFGDNPSTFPYKLGERPGVKGGNKYTIPVEFSSVPSSILQNGAKATIQVICHFSPTIDLYQCADATIDNARPVDPAPTSVAPSSSVAVVVPPPSTSTGAAVPPPTSSASADHDHDDHDDHNDHDHSHGTATKPATSSSSATTVTTGNLPVTTSTSVASAPSNLVTAGASSVSVGMIGSFGSAIAAFAIVGAMFF
ncbi:hypothetical protein BC829DRAFT_434908 [Chytridium lagenaria]|nr:hypothetical protein BC829DRAFT_434908 [Chytridium lagenaria]